MIRPKANEGRSKAPRSNPVLGARSPVRLLCPSGAWRIELNDGVVKWRAAFIKPSDNVVISAALGLTFTARAAEETLGLLMSSMRTVKEAGGGGVLKVTKSTSACENKFNKQVEFLP